MLRYSTARGDFESLHGIALPETARKLVTTRRGLFVGTRGVLDRGALSIFEADASGIEALTNSLQIKTNYFPTSSGLSDPFEFGYAVWPPNIQTFVPGNHPIKFSGKEPRAATPLQMFSADSGTADWLHVEVWKLRTNFLVKVYSDWN